MNNERVKAFIIIYDEEGNGSRGMEIDNMVLEQNEIPSFGKTYMSSSNIEASFSATNEHGEANLRSMTLYREQDPITNKWLETKNEFKSRERKHWQEVIKKRSIRK